MIRRQNISIKKQEKSLSFYAQGAQAWISPIERVDTVEASSHKVVSNVFLNPGDAFAIHVKNNSRACEYFVHFLNEKMNPSLNIIGDDQDNPTGYGTLLPEENDIYDIYDGPTWSEKGFVFTGSKHVGGVDAMSSNIIRVRFFFEKDSEKSQQLSDQKTPKMASRGIGIGGKKDLAVNFVDESRKSISRDMYKDYIFILKEA